MTATAPVIPAIEVQATSRYPLGMPADRFLAEVWQRRPLLVRHAIADMRTPLTPEDLAGLACEPLALSRLVVHDPARDRWDLRMGPFTETDFAALPRTHWTLLVQDVDKWDADVAALLRRFDFLPSWRIDDIMVSYAVDGGSVGAHIDHYDVFLLQGQGRRRWQISTDASAPQAFRDDVELKLLREFSATHEWLLDPGDMLYLPPGIAHHGVAEGPCLTFSIGMRAPALAEMVADLAATLAESLPEDLRYADAGIGQARVRGEIDSVALERVEAALRPLLAVDASLLRYWFGSFITRYRLSHDSVPRPRALAPAGLQDRLARGARLVRNPWTRVAWMRTPRAATLFVAGSMYAVSRGFATQACADRPLTAESFAALRAGDRAVLLDLVNAGHFALTRTRATRSSS